jgi:hypothetical protein
MSRYHDVRTWRSVLYRYLPGVLALEGGKSAIFRVVRKVSGSLGWCIAILRLGFELASYLWNVYPSALSSLIFPGATDHLIDSTAVPGTILHALRRPPFGVQNTLSAMTPALKCAGDKLPNPELRTSTMRKVQAVSLSGERVILLVDERRRRPCHGALLQASAQRDT